MSTLEVSTGWDLVVYERQQRRVFHLPEIGSVTIGRAPRCDVRLQDDSVSREHARLHLPSLEVEDLDSRNGSWVIEGAPDAASGMLFEHGADDGARLLPGERRCFGPGVVLKLGEVVSQVKPSAPAVHTLPIPARQDSDEPVLEDRSTVELYGLAERSAQTSLPLLILGETGVGKGVLASWMHRASARRHGPLVRINCGALSEALLEGELFGRQLHGHGAPHGAKSGLLELAHGGSVFLDEIGELPLPLQVKLLHVLETNQVTRVGATTSRNIDVRFIAATSRELARDVQSGAFRKDLYFRINTLCLKIKPLRERRPDILPLARHFLSKLAAGSPDTGPELSPEAATHLQEYDWPGNVRELKNAVERARLLCGAGPLLPDHFPTERELVNRMPAFADIWTEAEAPTRAGQRPPESSERPIDGGHAALLEALNSCSGNQTRAAQLLGISRRTMVNRLNQFNVPRPRKGRT